MTAKMGATSKIKVTCIMLKCKRYWTFRFSFDAFFIDYNIHIHLNTLYGDATCVIFKLHSNLQTKLNFSWLEKEEGKKECV